jgi:hypothetical protein
MEFRLAYTFTDSLARLNTEEQKAAKNHGARSATESGASKSAISQAGESQR